MGIIEQTPRLHLSDHVITAPTPGVGLEREHRQRPLTRTRPVLMGDCAGPCPAGLAGAGGTQAVARCSAWGPLGAVLCSRAWEGSLIRPTSP